jgi:hypothetical protein
MKVSGPLVVCLGPHLAQVVRAYLASGGFIFYPSVRDEFDTKETAGGLIRWPTSISICLSIHVYAFFYFIDISLLGIPHESVTNPNPGEPVFS